MDPMTRQDLNAQDLDSWHDTRNLERVRAPVRHAIAAWVLAGAVALVAVLGPPATREAAAGLRELRHDVLVLDRKLERVSAHFQARAKDPELISVDRRITGVPTAGTALS